MPSVVFFVFDKNYFIKSLIFTVIFIMKKLKFLNVINFLFCIKQICSIFTVYCI